MYVVCAKWLIGLSNSSTLFWLFFTSMNESNWEATLPAKVDKKGVCDSQKLGCTQAWQTQFTAVWRTFLLWSYITVHNWKPTKLQSLLPRHVLTAPVWGVIVVACHGKMEQATTSGWKSTQKNDISLRNLDSKPKVPRIFVGVGSRFLVGNFPGIDQNMHETNEGREKREHGVSTCRFLDVYEYISTSRFRKLSFEQRVWETIMLYPILHHLTCCPRWKSALDV